VYYYASVKDDKAVIEKLSGLAESKPSRGFPYYFGRIRNEGLVWNHKRVKRLDDLLRLNKRKNRLRRLPQRLLGALQQLPATNITWSMDFMHDTLANGRKIRVFNVIDDYNREVIAMNVDYSHLGHSLCKVLE
jgi:putative transposase